MVQTLVTLMMVYERKPSRVQCEQVAIDLVRKYPLVADPLGKAHVSTTHLFVIKTNIIVLFLGDLDGEVGTKGGQQKEIR